jgi:adenosylmethionine-8-amino-7-oxononanoate aminotransferase
MVGIELTKDRSTKTPFSPEQRVGARVVQNVRKMGVILRPLGDVVVLMPPLSITGDEIRFLVSAATEAIIEICGTLEDS